MRYLWCVNALPDYAKGARAGIDGYFLGGFDSTTTQLSLLDIKLAKGIYFASNWSQFDGKTAEQCAKIVEARYLQLKVPNLRVQWDQEVHDPGKIIATLEELRRLQPSLPLSWTLEGMQGGWIRMAEATINFVKRLVACRVRVVPQSYYGGGGGMEGVYDALAVARDLTWAGVPDALISPFYDAAALPRGWQGFAFEQNRLPS